MPNVKSTKVLQKRSDAALESFHKYYAGLWGEDRWHKSLFPALIESTRYCALVNRFASFLEVQALLRPLPEDKLLEIGPVLTATSSAEVATAVTYPIVLHSSTERSFPTPLNVSSAEPTSRISSHWNLDLASVLAAAMLQARPGEQVLDLCAAPGGKSIVLAQMLWPGLHADAPATDSEGTTSMTRTCLHSNESDRTRHKRLEANMQSYLPSRLFTDSAVRVVRIDASEKSALHELPLGAGGYDKVLLDAPCSSERHIIHAHLKASTAGQIAEELANWKASHTKTLAKTQAALLMTALKAVKLGGKVLYATCSISREENDDVIERTIEAVKRKHKNNTGPGQSSWEIKIDTTFEPGPESKSLVASMTESTKYGRIALPDHVVGGRWGPLYFCLMQKVPYKSKTESTSNDNI